MKREMKIFGTIAVCLLMVSVVVPNICLAAPDECEFEDIEANKNG
ncbi:MAG: hypothetical protein MOIL_01821 [Candidatus Methanolliviera sp. GoM_oil]|nr:MAG: hypothetical protein MOIL_01821 [Candidatus Methanolliviera sp. GoM_oil]